MAVIQIPIGGRPVPIEVPDFAMESTQQDLLNVTQRMASALGALDGSDGTKQAIDNLTGAVQDSNANQRNIVGTFREMNRGATGLATSAQRLGDVTKAGEFSKRIFDALGLATLGVQFGLIFGYAEELGEVFNKTARVGVNFGEDLLKVQSDAASLGLTLDQFGKIVGTQGTIMKGLGEDTDLGSRRFLQIGNALRDATRDVGFFGLKSDEMAMILADELEVRRQTIGSERLRLTTDKELTAQMRESFAINEAMARLTGQDIQERRKAQMEARRGAVAQSFLSEQTMETQRRFAELAGSLSTVAGGQELSQAILTGIATGMDPRAFSAKLIGMLGDGASELIDYATSAVTNEGIGVEDFAKKTQELALKLKDSSALNANSLRVMAAFGDNTAETILEVQTKTIEAIDNFGEEFTKTLDDVIGDAKANAGLRGLSATMDQVAAQIKTATGDFVTSLTGGGVGDLAKSVTGMATSFADELGKEDSQFRKVIREMGEVFGAIGVQPIERLLGITDPGGTVQQGLDIGFMSSLIAKILGQDRAAAIALAPTIGAVGLNYLTQDPRKQIEARAINQQISELEDKAIRAQRAGDINEVDRIAEEIKKLGEKLQQALEGTLNNN